MKAAAAIEQFVTDAKGVRVAVMLDLKRYERLLDAEDELADIRAFDAAWPQAKGDLKAGKTILLDEYISKRTRRK